jgi:hypothetical protein
LKKFSVSKQGEGMNTRYTLIPLDWRGIIQDHIGLIYGLG